MLHFQWRKLLVLGLGRFHLWQKHNSIHQVFSLVCHSLRSYYLLIAQFSLDVSLWEKLRVLILFWMRLVVLIINPSETCLCVRFHTRRLIRLAADYYDVALIVKWSIFILVRDPQLNLFENFLLLLNVKKLRESYYLDWLIFQRSKFNC